ncbi:Lrp/AsnC family transcriptional regulator [Thermococcus sp. SY098]|uniref:Lrp/AsnC family transcriptional regulator n=1 Tax=Thermococcus sp. SY098 TaxID=3111325 RepID=UPI002D78065D|nr:Lrp/AsnC family transcriptional regulator [Thermococcus sp. SY098]WRS53506.1 Lrp/AsnC family transcriptional regulator [Thermococcus sp. SY098]
MDERDLLIYRLLRKNGRMKVSEIARELGISHPSARERLEKLERRGDLRVQALLNIRKRNFVSAVVNLKVRSMDEAEKLADVFAKCPRTVFVATTTGKYNLNLALIAESYSALEATIENTIRPMESVKEMDVSLGSSPAYPEFVDFKLEPTRKVAPCGKVCTECYIYGKKCSGCPATVYFMGLGGGDRD